MERIWKKTAKKEQTVGAFLSESMGLTKRQISQAKFRKDGICVNGVQRRINYIVHPGEEVAVKLEEEQKTSAHLLLKEGKLDILWEDDDILVINKPAGFVVHPSHGHYGDSLGNMVMAYARNKGENLCVRAIGRLDKETSGIIIFAKNQVGAARLSAKREKGTFCKTYLAFAEGTMENQSGTVNIPIRKKAGSLMKMEADAIEGKAAITHYRTRENYGNMTSLEVKIETGRTHQIRVHMAYLGHPLLGDRLYGSSSQVIQRAALHAWKTEFLHPFSGEKLCFVAEIPEDMRNLETLSLQSNEPSSRACTDIWRMP